MFILLRATIKGILNAGEFTLNIHNMTTRHAEQPLEWQFSTCLCSCLPQSLSKSPAHDDLCQFSPQIVAGLTVFHVFLFSKVFFFLIRKTFLKLLAYNKFQPLTVVNFLGTFSLSLAQTFPKFKNTACNNEKCVNFFSI